MSRTRIFFDGPEGAEIDCPDCGGDAIVNDSGVFCPTCSEN